MQVVCKFASGVRGVQNSSNAHRVHQMGPGTIHCSRKSMDESWRSINDECLAVMVFLKMTETIPCKRVGARIEDDRFAGFPPNLRSVLSPDVVSPALVSCARKFSETE